MVDRLVNAAVPFLLFASIGLAACGGGSGGGDAAPAPQGPPGTLDASFGIGGIVSGAERSPPPGATINSIAAQADGKIVAAGSSGQHTVGHGIDQQGTIVRYSADGTLDPTFGNGGIVRLGMCCSTTFGAVAVMPDGRIVGMFTRAGSECNVARFNANGTFDSTFGGDGTGIVSVPSRTCRAMALRADGKVVLGGVRFDGVSTSYYWLMRLNGDGSRDATFGEGGGEVTGSIKPFYFTDFNAIALEADGGVVAVGAGWNAAPASPSKAPVVARFDRNGRPVTGFGDAGIVVIGIDADPFGFANGVAVHADGRVVAVGASGSGDGALRAILIRLLPNGALDPGFGRSGVVAWEPASNARGVALQPNGKLLVIGAVELSPASGRESVVARYGETGTPDAGFGTGGSVNLPGPQGDGANALAVLSDGRICVGGTDSSDFVSQLFWAARFYGDPVVAGRT